MPTAPTLPQLRTYAVARSLFKPTTLPKALARLGFVQADPIRAPARAQDLTLRHRVAGYRAGDLERRYARLDVEEDFFVNYGFVPRATQRLMHPREAASNWTAAKHAQAQAVLDFVRHHGVVHPRQVDAQFQHGNSANWFGGNSKASTQLLDSMHYRGWLRVAGRDSGTRTYAAREPHAPAADPQAALDALVDVIVQKYAPLPEASLSNLTMRLVSAAPQWQAHRRDAMQRAKLRLPKAWVEGQTWYWPEGENPCSKRHVLDDELRLLAPFDPVVWDRRRFEAFWGWAYRFEAYTPAPKRVRGYYALPLLWQGQVIGWGNAAVQDNRLHIDWGFQAGRKPRGTGFGLAKAAETARLQAFLGLQA